VESIYILTSLPAIEHWTNGQQCGTRAWRGRGESP